ADALAEQGDVERLLEPLAEAVVDERLRGGLVLAGEGDHEGGFVVGVAAEVLGNLEGLAAAHGQVDDDAGGVEALGLDAGLEAAVGDAVLVLLVLGEQLLEAVDEELLGADDEDLVPALLLQLPEGHAVLLEEADEVLAGNAPVLAAGDAVARS